MEHKIYTEGESTFIERLIYPRFKALITFSANIVEGDLGEPLWIDKEPEPEEFMLIAKVLREAGAFIANYKK